MTGYAAGKEVLSYCTKCKLPLAHTIMAMKNENTFGKVKCNTCKTVHAFKDPSTVKAKTKGRRITTKKKSTDSVSDLWMEALDKSSSKSQAYSPKKKFEIGDIIDHPTNGPGVIDRMIDNNKIQVIFRHEIKTLMHNLG